MTTSAFPSKSAHVVRIAEMLEHHAWRVVYDRNATAEARTAARAVVEDRERATAALLNEIGSTPWPESDETIRAVIAAKFETVAARAVAEARRHGAALLHLEEKTQKTKAGGVSR